MSFNRRQPKYNNLLSTQFDSIYELRHIKNSRNKPSADYVPSINIVTCN